jgi:UDP-4-amino-4,6-dideoxy-N-acetyl-beta-L-altrosamine transaminase
MNSTKKFLPFALPSIGKEEIEEVIDSMQSGWLTTGPKTKQFEQDFCDFVGCKYAVAVNSATAGLHLAVEAVGIKEGDKVVTTPYTFTASAEIIRYMGADPIFVDIDKKTFNLNPSLLEKACKKNPEIKAIIPVHFAGQACDMIFIREFADRQGLFVIEDAAHALPATYQGKMIGNFSDLSVFSFYANKTITTGEGGMVVTGNKEFAERIRTMRLHGINQDIFDRYTSEKPSWYYEVVALGFKYNMTDIAASIGIHQLKKASKFQEKRRKIAEYYNDSFKELPLQIPFQQNLKDIHSWHLYVIQLELEKLSCSRDRFIELMTDAGIGTSVHFIPLHLHPYWKGRYRFVADDFPVAFDVFQRVVSLPIYPAMTDDDVERVVSTVRCIIKKNIKV